MNVILNNFRTKFVRKYCYNSFLFDNIMLSDAQIAESLDEILQDVDSDDDFLDFINFDDAVEPELQGNLFILHYYFILDKY